MNYKEIFANFLAEQFPQRKADLMLSFGRYLDLLFELNRQVNLVSRRMAKDKYWLYHFLDSLLALKCMDLTDGTALDFGSGGGLPGLPLKLVCPDLQMTLLDSVGKKVKCLQKLVSDLAICDCCCIWVRLEEFAESHRGKGFDYIFCRSVKIEPEFLKPLAKLLNKNGLAVFYKAQQWDDVCSLPDIQVFDVSRPDLGQRKIILAGRQSLLTYTKDRKL